MRHRHLKTVFSHLNWQVTTQTTIHGQLHWRYQNDTNTRRPEACILRRQITFCVRSKGERKPNFVFASCVFRVGLPVYGYAEFLQRLGPLLCYFMDVMGLNDSNHFSDLTSALRAKQFKSRSNFGLRSAYELKSRANFGLRSAYEYKSIYINRPCARSRSRVWWGVKEFRQGEFFSLFDNVFKLFSA